MKFTSLRASDFRNLKIENVDCDSKSVIPMDRERQTYLKLYTFSPMAHPSEHHI